MLVKPFPSKDIKRKDDVKSHKKLLDSDESSVEEWTPYHTK